MTTARHVMDDGDDGDDGDGRDGIDDPNPDGRLLCTAATHGDMGLMGATTWDFPA